MSRETCRTCRTKWLAFAVAVLALLSVLLGSGCDRSRHAGYTDLNVMDQPYYPSATNDAEPTTGKILPPPAGQVYFGAFAADAPFDMEALGIFERRAGKPLALLMWYQPWGTRGRNMVDRAYMDALKDQGAVPVITWEPWSPPPDTRTLENPELSPEFRLKDINFGKYDSYIRGWARALRHHSAPVMLRPMHEMNGNWYPWAGTVNGNEPEEYVIAWRRIHDMFEQEGATNVTWLWSVNAENHPDIPENDIDVYYPGDEYVDWVGLSALNYGVGEPWGSKWTSVEKLYRAPYTRLLKYKKPIAFAEIASVERGGDKAAWIRKGLKDLPRRFPKAKAMIWFNFFDGGRPFPIQSSPRSVKGFRKAVSGPEYLSSVRHLTRAGMTVDSRAPSLP